MADGTCPGRRRPVTASSAPQASDEELTLLKDGQRTIYESGWAGISWPLKYGARGASFIERVIFDEEIAAQKAPGLLNVLGLEVVGPTIIAHGSKGPKRRNWRIF